MSNPHLKVLLTSGGTKIPIDRVRHIGNMSRGTFGAKIAWEGITQQSWDVTFLHAKGSRSPFKFEVDLTKHTPGSILTHVAQEMGKLPYLSQYTPAQYDSFDTYAEELERLARLQPDIIVLAAAVSDYGTIPVNGKIRTGGDLNIPLTPLPKLISKVREWAPNSTLVGFKLLVDSTDEQLIEAAYSSIIKNHCDLVVANDLRDIKANAHRVLMVTNNNGQPRVETYSTEQAATVAKRVTEVHQTKTNAN